MALSYDIKKDAFYQEGQKEKEKELIIEMLKDGTLTVEKIASLAKVSVDFVRKVAKEMKMK
jgi:predicted HTH domain antitoxin